MKQTAAAGVLLISLASLMTPALSAQSYSLSLIPFTRIQADVNGVAIEHKIVMAHTALCKQLFCFPQQFAPPRRVFRNQGQDAQYAWTDKIHAGLAANP